MKKKNRELFKKFESSKSNGRFIMIAYDMIKSTAYQDLTMTQRQLYFEMKSEYRPDHNTNGIIIPANDQNICFPCSRWKPLYKNNQRKWTIDRDSLILHGFIELAECGKTTRTPNVYRLSGKWKEWKAANKKE